MPGLRDLVVGRAREREDLLLDLTSACAGSGRVVIVSGAAGIGKTVLAQQLLARAAELSVPAARGRWVDDEGAPPLWPWTQAVARVASDEESVATTGGDQDSAAARFLLVDRLGRQLVRAAEPDGMVVVLEDLQWAEPASLQMLGHLAGEIVDSRLLVVVTARTPLPAEVGAAVDAVLREPGCRAQVLDPLDVGAIAEYLTTRTGTRPSGVLLDEVRRRTSGSPLLLAAVAGALATDAADVSGDDLWARVAQAADVTRLAGGMLATLQTGPRDLIELAAVRGETIDPQVLAEVAERPDDQITAALRAGLTAGLLVTEPGADGYRFAHALVRDALVAGLDPVRRRDLNLLIGRRLAVRAELDPAYAAARAGHLQRGGATPEIRHEAGLAAAEAAREAGRRLGFEDAVRWWAAAVEALELSRAEPEQVALTAIELSAALYRAGRIEESLAAATRAAALAGALGRADLLARAAVVIQGIDQPEVLSVVGGWCEQAMAQVDAGRGELPPQLLAEVLAQWAGVQAEVGDPVEAERASSRALELARESGDPGALLAAVHARVRVRNGADGVAEMLSLGAIAIREAGPAGRPVSALLGHNWRCDAAYWLGNVDAAMVETEAVGRLAAVSRLPLARWHHLRMLACRALMEGRFDDGLAISDEACEIGMRIGDFSAAGLSGAYLFHVALITGRPELLQDLRYEHLREAAPAIPIMQAANASVWLSRGQVERAQEHFQTVRPLLFDPPDHRRWRGVLSYLIDVAVPLGDGEAAGLILEHLKPWAAFPGGLSATTVMFRGSIQRDLGRLTATAGDLATAEPLMRSAIQTNLRWGARPFVVLGRLELAELLERREALGSEVEDLARAAAREARKLGMPGPLRRADEVLSRRAARTPVDPLTAREREIAGLVAQAMTNKEIAAELFLSERTVESHVRNILAKLGFSGRTEIAAWALTRA